MNTTGEVGTIPSSSMVASSGSTSLRTIAGISGIVTSSWDDTTKVVGGTSLRATDAITRGPRVRRSAARATGLARVVLQDSRKATGDWSGESAPAVGATG